MEATYDIRDDAEHGWIVVFFVGSSQFTFLRCEVEEAVENGICARVNGDDAIFRICVDELKERGLIPH